MFDISLCSAENCPRYMTCARGGGEIHNPGIHIVSNYADECNEITNYGWYIPHDYKDWSKKI